MPYRSRYSGMRRKVARLVTQSYKQVSVDGPASRTASTTIIHNIVNGVDNYTGPTAANAEVPTGAVVKSIDIQCAFSNLVSVSALLFLTIQLKRDGQTTLAPNAQGGSPGRNRVFYTRMVFLGEDQNSNYHFRFKVPKKFQRIREGDQWNIAYTCNQVYTSATQAIYKFYR